jgi:hypothetical protein
MVQLYFFRGFKYKTYHISSVNYKSWGGALEPPEFNVAPPYIGSDSCKNIRLMWEIKIIDHNYSIETNG